MTLNEDIHATHEALKEARTDLWAEKARKPHQWDNETDEHFKGREKREEARRKEREKVVKHLKQKFDHLIAERKQRQDQKDAEGPFDPTSTAIVVFDGKQVVESAAHWLWLSRQHGWVGSLVSGYRTPEYSESLCYAMCGAPSCPGRCAGRATNHAKTTYPGPAVDVSDYGNFERIQFEIGSPLRNDLPIDPVHFSPSGH